MKRLPYILLLLSPVFFFNPSFSQQKNLPLNREWGLNYEKSRSLITSYTDTFKSAYATRIGCHNVDSSSCFKPSIEPRTEYVLLNTLGANKDTVFPTKQWNYYFGKIWRDKLFRENLIIIKDSADKFHLTIDPLFNFEIGRDRASIDTFPENLYKNTRGILVRGDIGKKFSFESSFLENQAAFAQYIDDHIDSLNNAFPNAINYQYKVIPGQGRAKTFKMNGYDFGYSSGYVSYSPNPHFNIQVGHGKHFVGDGYRSLLLSDNSFNYPFARITTSFGEFQYTNLYASFMNLTDGGVVTPPGTERLFQKKAASFQFLSWNAHKRIQLGIFQGLVWKASDSKNRMFLNASYFNPIIGISAAEFGLDHENNILFGSTLKLKITNSISLYGQVMLDETSSPNNNKKGFQVGAKYFDMFGIKNLHLQFEYNQVNAYSFSSKNPTQSYSHYNQPLAHPLGANFKEGITFLNFRTGDFFTEIRISFANTGNDPSNYNFGNNLFTSDTSYLPPSNLLGETRILTHSDFHIGYLVNPSTNFNIILGIANRSSLVANETSDTNFIYFGIRTSLSNIYYDF